MNSWDVDRFIESIRATTGDPTIGRWLDRVARRWIIKAFPAAGHVVRLRRPAGGAKSYVDVAWPTGAGQAFNQAYETTYESPHPAWLEAALPDGVFWLDMDGCRASELSVELSDILAYFGSLEATKRGRIERISLPDAAARARRFCAAARPTPDATLISFPEGFRVALLETPESLALEGARMNHCVASYAGDLAQGSDILSLRDAQDRPHVTMEVDEGRWLDQVKGKANGTVAGPYRPYIAALIEELGLTIRGDQELVGITSRSFDPSDPKSWRNQPRLPSEIRRDIAGLPCQHLDTCAFYGDLGAVLETLDEPAWSWLLGLFEGTEGALVWPEPSGFFELGREVFFVVRVHFPRELLWVAEEQDGARSRALAQRILAELDALVLRFCLRDDRSFIKDCQSAVRLDRDVARLRRLHLNRVGRRLERARRKSLRNALRKRHSERTRTLWDKNYRTLSERLKDARYL